jgi:hypothetical protein
MFNGDEAVLMLFDVLIRRKSYRLWPLLHWPMFGSQKIYSLIKNEWRLIFCCWLAWLEITKQNGSELLRIHCFDSYNKEKTEPEIKGVCPFQFSWVIIIRYAIWNCANNLHKIASKLFTHLFVPLGWSSLYDGVYGSPWSALFIYYKLDIFRFVIVIFKLLSASYRTRNDTLYSHRKCNEVTEKVKHPRYFKNSEEKIKSVWTDASHPAVEL